MSPTAENADNGHQLLTRAALDRLEGKLDRLLAMVGESGDQVGVLVRHFTEPSGSGAAGKDTAELLSRLDAAGEQVERLEAAVTRQTRMQFKTNALLESKEQQVAAAVAALKEVAARREAAAEIQATEEAQRRADLRAEGRAELAADLLPVLDGIERALESGYSLMDERRTRSSERRRDGGLWESLVRAFSSSPGAPSPEEDARLAAALGAWLEGLKLGRERLLALLAGADVRPIPAEGALFDPRLHLAVSTEERRDLAPGTIVGVLQTGYLFRERPIRFAEVVVARSPAGEGAATERKGSQEWPTES